MLTRKSSHEGRKISVFRASEKHCFDPSRNQKNRRNEVSTVVDFTRNPQKSGSKKGRGKGQNRHRRFWPLLPKFFLDGPKLKKAKKTTRVRGKSAGKGVGIFEKSP